MSKLPYTGLGDLVGLTPAKQLLARQVRDDPGPAVLAGRLGKIDKELRGRIDSRIDRGADEGGAGGCSSGVRGV